MCHLDDGGGVGHLCGGTVRAKCLSADLIDAVFGKDDRFTETVAGGNGCFAIAGICFPFFGKRPSVVPLTAILDAYTLETLVLAVQVGQRDHNTSLLDVVIIVENSMVGADFHVC